MSEFKNLTQDKIFIHCESLTKIFKGIETSINLVVLKSIDLVIPRFTLTGIMGPSGSGKTTLLNVLSAIASFEGGKVVIDGIVLNDLKKRHKHIFWREKVSFISQFPEDNLFMNLTVSENLLLSASKFLNRKTRKQMIKNTLATVQLSDFENMLAKTLSGGELQRLAIAMAIIRKTPIILADEPTGELDNKNSARIFKLFQRLTNEKIFTCIIVSHDKTLHRFCDQAYILLAGVLSQINLKSNII